MTRVPTANAAGKGRPLASTATYAADADQQHLTATTVVWFLGGPGVALAGAAMRQHLHDPATTLAVRPAACAS